MLKGLERYEKKMRSLDKWFPPINPTPPASLVDAIVRQLPEWAIPMLDSDTRFKCLHGGRGSGKSYAVADVLLIKASRGRRRILCTREFQTSIRDSVHSLLKERIKAHNLDKYFTVTNNRIICPFSGEFLFAGMHRNIDNIKSIPALTDAWLEEGQSISKSSWDVFTPTIRENDSQIYVTFNPKFRDDVVYESFVNNPRPDAYISEVNWSDNGHFPNVLNKERLYMLETDPELYKHVWEGGLYTVSDAQILKGKWVVKAFVPETYWDGPYLGADFGFSQDPCTLSKSWVYDDHLYVEYESYAEHLEITDTAQRWKTDVPGCEKFTIRADCSRPEMISYLRNEDGMRVVPCKKGPGSVEDGIANLRSYKKIIIHPRCTHHKQEAIKYSFKEDKHTGEILPIVVKKNDHCMDALRYAQEPVMKRRNMRWLAGV